MTTPATWEPGHPLHESQGSSGYYQFRPLFNFRDDDPTDHCLPCPDAASWPNPRAPHELRGEDEVERLIRYHRLNQDRPAS